MSLPAEISARLKALLSTPLPEVPAITPLRPQLPELSPGVQVSARILDPRPDGTYRAVVAGRTLTLALAQSVKSGDVLELAITRSTPQALFARLAEPSGEATPRPQLSSTAQVLSQLMAGQLGKAEPTELGGSQALVKAQANGEPFKAAQLVPALKQGLEQSGLFYEAHQARWLNGEMPLVKLLEEPQARFGLQQKAQSAAPEGKPTAPAADPLAHRAAAEAPNDKPAAPALATNTKVPTPAELLSKSEHLARPSPAGTALEELVPKELSKLVHQQLDALVSQQLNWQGQVWPGQLMQWRIDLPQRGGSQGADTSGDEAASWRTQLRLTLPALGELSAQLVLTPAGIAIRLDANSAAAADQLEARFPELQQALEASGIAVTGHAVGRQPDGG